MHHTGRDARGKQAILFVEKVAQKMCGTFFANIRFSSAPSKSTLRYKGMILVVISLFVPLSVLFGGAVLQNYQAQAAPADTLNFQGRLLSSTGALVADGDYHIEFKLYNDTSSAGTPDQGACTYGGGTPDTECLWTETRSTGNLVTIQDGYFSVYLGDVTALPSIDW